MIIPLAFGLSVSFGQTPSRGTSYRQQCVSTRFLRATFVIKRVRQCVAITINAG